MNRTHVLSIAALFALAGCGAAGTGSMTPLPAAPADAPAGAVRAPQYSRALPAVCNPLVGELGCFVEVNLAVIPILDPYARSIAGLTPADLRSAYGLPPAGNAAATGPLIAVVAAYDDPGAESNLAVYRARFGLPPCTRSNGCLSVSRPPGYSSRFDLMWSAEVSLDLAMASAACPSCRLALVEAANGNPNVLAQAVDAAAALHPAAISNSYGIPDRSTNAQQDTHYDHPGIAVVASTGDDGTVQYPASSAHVTAVGGTVLERGAGSRGWHETVWNRSGAGCSAAIAAPAWQRAAGCATRSVPDVSFTAALNPGVAVYDLFRGGWVVLGGTSVGAPFIAGLYAQARDFAVDGRGAQSIYAHAGALNAVDALGTSSTPGSPNGLGAF